MDEETMKKLALFNGVLKDRNDTDDSAVFISSLNDAKILLRQHMTPSGAEYRRKVVEYMVNPANRVLSECDEFHNFIMDLFRVGDYDLALKVCDFALVQAPLNRDILGDAIKACGDSSQFEKGDKFLERAMEIPRERWSFRLFLYSVDFLKTKLCANPLDDNLYTQALSLADDYIKYLPFDEHGYNQKAELYLLMNQREKAISELKRYIFETQPDEKDSKSELITAQCCVTLLNILDDSNNYDFIIDICERGLRNTTQEQPHASIGFFVYRKALALDAKAHDEKFKVPDTITMALRFYQAAYDLNQDRGFGDTIEQRYAVLRPYASSFEPLVRRNLYKNEKGESRLLDE